MLSVLPMRRLNSNRGVFLLAFLLLPTQAWSQAAVRVVTNAPDSRVLVDSVEVGQAALQVFAVEPGAHTLTLVPAVPDAWGIPPLNAVFTAAAGDTMRIELLFPYHYRIETLPPMAQVRSASGLLGTTPLLLTQAKPLGVVSLEKKGYASFSLRADSALWNPYLIRLEPQAEDSMPEVGARSEGSRAWINWVAGGVAAAAGTVAVYYKFRADDLFERYEGSGDPDLRPRIERFDLYSGISLGVMQAGLGVIAFRLIFD